MKKEKISSTKDYCFNGGTYHVTRIFGEKTVKDLVKESISEKKNFQNNQKITTKEK